MTELTLAEHAELWWAEQGNTVPERDTPEWNTMYTEWAEWAFEGFDRQYDT